jgi:outer membrane protein OmpA-like peptidoglycan-associated protein
VPSEGGVFYYRAGPAATAVQAAGVDPRLLRRLVREELDALQAAGDLRRVSDLDVLRLEAALQRGLADRLARLRDLDPGRTRAVPPAPPGRQPVIVLPGGTTGIPPAAVPGDRPGPPAEPADPARILLPAPRVMIPGVEPLPAARVATDIVRVEIERELLETGLFRAVNVNFEFDSAELLPSARHALDAVGDVLQRHPTLEIEVQGHTDNVGSAAYNQGLSERRARAVRDYLLARFPALESERIAARGYGPDQPIASNASPTGRALNRRVDFVVTLRPVEEPDTAVEVVPLEGEETDKDRLERIIREELERLR